MKWFFYGKWLVFENIENELDSIRTLVRDSINLSIEPEESIRDNFKVLYDATKYVMTQKGNLWRPIMLVLSADTCGADRKLAVQSSVAIEMAHNYSLVHDDLPALDNDDYRRGMPTCHKKFGEANAILLGDSLLTQSFEIITKLDVNASIRSDLVECLSKRIGHSGMVRGQIIDINSDIYSMNQDELLELRGLKTGALFSAACEFGAIIANSNTEARKALSSYGYNFGIAYQVLDDAKDELKGNKELLEHYFPLYLNKALKSLELFDVRSQKLRQFTQYILNRE